MPRKWFPPGQDAWNSPSLLRHFQQTFKPTTLFHSSISTTRRLTWLQKMLREIGESPGSITFIFRKCKEQTAWSLVGGNAERLICPNQDFSILFVTIFRLSAGVSALQLSPVGVTSQYTTERTTNKQFTALTASNTALLSLREYNKPIENDQILQ